MSEVMQEKDLPEETKPRAAGPLSMPGHPARAKFIIITIASGLLERPIRFANASIANKVSGDPAEATVRYKDGGRSSPPKRDIKTEGFATAGQRSNSK